jgi:hypothetical protein
MAIAEEAAERAAALEDLAQFPLMEALIGRRSRRFALGDELPDGPLAYKSKHEPLPLTELERALVLASMGGTTGWHYGITRHERYVPHIANYRAVRLGAPSRRPPASIPPSSSSPTTRAPISFRPVTPVP